MIWIAALWSVWKLAHQFRRKYRDKMRLKRSSWAGSCGKHLPIWQSHYSSMFSNYYEADINLSAIAINPPHFPFMTLCPGCFFRAKIRKLFTGPNIFLHLSDLSIWCDPKGKMETMTMIEIPPVFLCSIHSVETPSSKPNFKNQFLCIQILVSEIRTAVEQRQKGRIMVHVLFLCIERTIRGRGKFHNELHMIYCRSLQHWNLLWKIYFYFLARHLLYFKGKGVNKHLKAYWNSKSFEKFQAQNMTLVNPPNSIPKFIFPIFFLFKNN